MTTKQQENLLFTLDFPQLERLYQDKNLTPLEQELFRRVKEMDSEQQNLDRLLYDHGMHIETLESDIESVMETIRDLETERDNLKDDIKEKDDEIGNLKDELVAWVNSAKLESEV